MDKEEVKQLEAELKSASVLNVLGQSEGGKELINALADDIVGAVSIISSQSVLLSHTEFIALACRIKERLEVIRMLNKAETDKEFLEVKLKEVLAQQ